MNPPTLEQRLGVRERPARSPVMFQRWNRLLFLHWECDPDFLQRTLPPGLHIDTHDGKAYLGLIPFFMNDIRPVNLPAVPYISNFMELNVRTSVYDDNGTPGVWFYSLSCNNPLAVWIARSQFRLPYFHARMRSTQDKDGLIQYDCRRKGGASSSYRYSLGDSLPVAAPGSLEFFLAERYVLFSRGKTGLKTGRVFHDPYPLVEAKVSEWSGEPFVADAMPHFERPPDHVIGSPGVSVDIFGLESTL